MRSNLFGANLESSTTDRFTLQNPRMLRVALDGEMMARQGAKVGYQGQVDFAYQGFDGMGKRFKKALTGEGMSLMKVSGRGDVFFANDAMEIHLVNLENDALTVNGSNVLAFNPTLTWDIKRVEGASMMAGPRFVGSGRSHPVWSRRWCETSDKGQVRVSVHVGPDTSVSGHGAFGEDSTDESQRQIKSVLP